MAATPRRDRWRRFEARTESSNKFWEIRVRGNRCEVRFGRIGKRGQSRSRELPSPAEARAAAERSVAQKLRKGYRAVDSSDATQRRGSRARNQNRRTLPKVEDLIQSIFAGDIDAVLAAIRAGFDVHQRDGLEQTLLSISMARGERGLIDALLDATTFSPEELDVALWSAIYEWNDRKLPKYVGKLCAYGANPNGREPYAPFRPFLAIAAAQENQNAVRALLDAGADPNECDHHGKNAWFHFQVRMAVKGAGARRIKALLLEAGANRAGANDVELGRAIENGDVDALGRLVSAREGGVDAPLHDSRYAGLLPEDTPLERACRKGNRGVVAGLLELGADPNASSSATPLLRAIEANALDVVELLLSSGVDPAGASNSGKTPIVAALRAYRRDAGLDVIRTLVEAGVPTARIQGAASARDLAQRAGQFEVVEWLDRYEGRIPKKRRRFRPPRGIDPNANAVQILVEAEAGMVRDAIVAKDASLRVTENAYLGTLATKSRGYVLWSLRRQAWTRVETLNHGYGKPDPLTPSFAKRLSKQLGCRSLRVGLGDTAGVLEIELFEDGALLEELRDRCEGLVRGKYRVQIDDESTIHFRSTLRRAYPKAEDPWYYTDRLVRSLGLFVFPDRWGVLGGERAFLELEGIPDEEIASFLLLHAGRMRIKPRVE